MRLLSLELDGFRGFAAQQAFDLDADAIVLVGANGNGKTSLLDAVLWALSGRVPRLGNDDHLLLCRFSRTGQARVAVRLRDGNGSSPITVTRLFDGKETRVSIETADGVFRGPEAEGRLIRLLWRDAATAASPAEALATVLTRSVYLQQDLVTQFIAAVTTQDRFAAVSELVGAGRVTDLQAELERAKAAWTKSTNSTAAELAPLRSRLSTMESRLAELKSRPIPPDTVLDETAWLGWWTQLKAFGLSLTPVRVGSREATEAIDAAITQLDALRRAADRRHQLLESLRRDLPSLASMPHPDPAPLRTQVERSREQLEATRNKVTQEQARVAEVRRRQAELTETSAQLRALATIALKHLGAQCPVCSQQYDREGTRRRLESIAKGPDPTSSPVSPPDTLAQLLTTLTSQEKELAAAELALRVAEQSARDYDVSRLVLQKRCQELGLPASDSIDPASTLNDARSAAQRQSDDLGAAQTTGEAFALRLSHIRDAAAIDELQKEIAIAQAKLSDEDAQLHQRVATGEQAQQVIEALRLATSQVVTARVKEIEPLLSDIYSRIDVHPAFRVVRFLASVVRGRGQLSTVVSDPLSEVESDSPEVVLSSSQMNALAVCTFLSLNLGVLRPPLQAAILDDPLQSLDDINLLGLIDLLRRTKDQRQLCVSTHDLRFGELLARKLRPRSADQRTLVIELQGWGRQGPQVAIRDIHCDPFPLRLLDPGRQHIN